MKQVGFWYSDAEPTFPWPIPQKEKWTGQDEFLLNLAWIEAIYWDKLTEVHRANAAPEPIKELVPFWEYSATRPRWDFIYQFIEHYRGSSWCRCCSVVSEDGQRGVQVSNGHREFRIEDWCWPEGFMHYVKEHNVEPPEDFKQWVLAKTFTGNHIPERELFEAVSHEDAEFIKQAAKYGKTEYRLSFTGAAFGNPLFIGRYGRPNVPRGDSGEMYEQAQYFDSAEDRDMFKAQVIEFLKLLPKFYNTLTWTESEGPMVRKQTIAVLSLLYKGKEYEITKNYGYGYEGHYAIFDWEENHAGCDCVRRKAIADAHPGVVDPEELEEDLCGDGAYPVTRFRIEYHD